MRTQALRWCDVMKGRAVSTGIIEHVRELAAERGASWPLRVQYVMRSAGHLLLREVYRQLVRRYACELVTIDAGACSKDEAVAMLHTNVVGGVRCCVVVHYDGHGKLKSLTQPWVKLLEEYGGPHAVLAVTPSLQLSTWRIIELSDSPSEDDLCALRELLGGSAGDVRTSYSRYVSTRGHKYDWNALYLLAAYETVLGSKAKEFCKDWLPHVVPAKHSLFALAGCFFAGDRPGFYERWAAVYAVYADEFWIAFWHEQLWHAQLFVGNAQSGKPVDTKGLPFSFVQKDWRHTSMHQLHQAACMIMRYDERLKSGGAIVWELLFEGYWDASAS